MVEVLQHPSSSSSSRPYETHLASRPQDEALTKARDPYSSLVDASPSNQDNPPLPPPKDFQPSSSSAPYYRSTSHQKLPAGMDIQEALAQCEDPALGWSLQFWATIADPVTGHVFFACPATGMCSWEPPVGAFLLPRQEEGEWWELADANRGNRSYYYNTLTGVTQWTRPTGNAFVIPLGLIQQTALPPRPATTTALRKTTPAHLSPNKKTHLAPPITSPDSPVRSGPRPPHSSRRPEQVSPTKNATQRGQLEAVEEISSQGTGTDEMRIIQRSRLPVREGSDSTNEGNDSSSSKSPMTPPAELLAHSLLDKVSPKHPIHVDSIRTKRMSTGLHPLLPPNLSSQINNLQSADSTKRYFATRRKGLTRQKVPIDRIMEWQRTPISNPILVISHSPKDAVTTFKIIQHVMAERERGVDIPRSRSGTTYGNGGGDSDKVLVLEEIRWTIQLAVSSREMRDEVYCQLIKQLTKNPNPESMILGFQLICVLVNAFSPNPAFEALVRSFLQHTAERSAGPVGIMAKYCIAKLEVMIAQSSRSKTLTLGEIEAASDAAFYPSVYGESLDRIMNLQQRSYPTLPIPVILPFLADGILALGGSQCEGIFRIPGDNESVSELKSRMDRGHYQLQGIDDPHVAASLFKMWLRELESPIVPIHQYNSCLAASSSVEKSIDFVRKLPVLNRRVVVFVISFIQLFLKPDLVEMTKMTASNLSVVLAPNLLRTTSDSLSTVYTNSAFEARFILNLLENLNPRMVDPEYIPEHGTPCSQVSTGGESGRL